MMTRAAIAQLGERQAEDLKVPGSIPCLGKRTALLCGAHAYEIKTYIFVSFNVETYIYVSFEIKIYIYVGSNVDTYICEFQN